MTIHFRDASVALSKDGWRVEVNGCVTAPIPDRKVATHLPESSSARAIIGVSIGIGTDAALVQ